MARLTEFAKKILDYKRLGYSYRMAKRKAKRDRERKSKKITPNGIEEIEVNKYFDPKKLHS